MCAENSRRKSIRKPVRNFVKKFLTNKVLSLLAGGALVVGATFLGNQTFAIDSYSSSDAVKPPDYACYVVFETEEAAAEQCPPGTLPIKVYDFWTAEFRGYSCDCKRASDNPGGEKNNRISRR